jgi:hypothetical protein
MKKFKIGLNEEIGGYSIIEAENISEAETVAEKIMAQDGIEGFKNKEIMFRSAEVVSVEETL